MRDSIRPLTNFTDMRIGATPAIDAGTLSLGPTATAAITDGRSIKRRITAVCRYPAGSSG
jgi:hypothetical protein